jgi:hypothetical protein
MTIPPSAKFEVLRTPEGKWFWWPDLEIVEYTRKRQQSPTKTVSLKDIGNTEEQATLIAVQVELNTRVRLVNGHVRG